MTNPISEATRARIYLGGVIIGILAVVVGPLMIALAVPDVWVAVITSLIGAITTLTSTLARANLGGSADNAGASEQ